MTDEVKGYLAALISCVSVAFGFIGMKFMMDYATALTAQSLFFLMGAFLSLGMLFFMRGHIRLQSLKRNWSFYSLICLLMAFTATTTFVSIDLIGPGPVSFVSQLGIVFAVVLGTTVFGERFRLLDGLGGLVAVLGAVWMSYAPLESMKAGVLLVASGALVLSFHNLVIKQHSAEIDKMELLFVRAVTTFLAVALLAMATGEMHRPPVWLIPVGALTSLFGFWAVNFFRYVALGYIDMSKESMLRVISPMIVTVISFVLFHAIPDREEVYGSLLILLGVSLILFRPLFQPCAAVSQAGR